MEYNIDGAVLYSGKDKDSATITITSKNWMMMPAILEQVQECGSFNIVISDDMTEIRNREFWELDTLTGVVISNSVTRIGSQAFWGCTALKNVVIGSAVTEIGEAAFSGCKALTSIVIPNSVKKIGRSAFYCCSALESVVIPEGVTKIRDWTFGDCSSLKSIILPDTVTEIEEAAFVDCKALTSMVIPKGVKKIASQAFCGCSALESVVIPEGVNEIEMYSLSECDSLSKVIYGGTREQWERINIADRNESLLKADVEFRTGNCEMGFEIRKYPRTPHLEGSRLQAGDEDLSQIPFSEIAGRNLVIEEKIDGANSAVSFDEDGTMLLQSRGHYLTGGWRERHYNLMKQWASVHERALYDALGTRYIMYGEWMYAKHSIFYDMLPHYFLEFDIYDRKEGVFLDTPGRRNVTEKLPVQSVLVIKSGVFSKKDDVAGLIGNSNYISENHIENLKAEALKQGLDAERTAAETDASRLMEGLYIKVEENGQVVRRLKYVRGSFLQTEAAPEGNWIDRAIVPNLLSCPLERLFES